MALGSNRVKYVPILARGRTICHRVQAHLPQQIMSDLAQSKDAMFASLFIEALWNRLVAKALQRCPKASLVGGVVFACGGSSGYTSMFSTVLCFTQRT